MERQTRFNVAYLVFAAFAVLLVQQWWQRAQMLEVVPYSEFEQMLAEGRIAEVTIGDRQVVGRLRQAESGKQIVVANRVEPDLAGRIAKYGVPYTRSYESTLLRDLLSWIVPALVFFGVWYFLADVPLASERDFSEQTAREIDVAVRDIVSAAHDKALAILRREKSTLERGARLLLEKETLAEADLAALRPRPVAASPPP